jgi:hypothetical protein
MSTLKLEELEELSKIEQETTNPILKALMSEEIKKQRAILIDDLLENKKQKYKMVEEEIEKEIEVFVDQDEELSKEIKGFTAKVKIIHETQNKGKIFSRNGS